MPNLIKSATTISNGTIKRNNFLIGVDTSLEYGPNFTPGSKDETFNIGTGFGGSPYSIQFVSNGKILVGGTFTTFADSTQNYLIRLNSDGSKDTSFDIGTGFNDWVWKVPIQSDGKVLVGGSFTEFTGSTQNGLIRLNSDGSKDTSFDIGTGFGGTDGSVRSILIQSDGKILVGGRFTTFTGSTQNYLIRLNSDGSKDTSFDIGSGFNNTVYSIAIQSDGKILVGGAFTTFTGSTQNRLIRLNSDGSKDTSFDIGTGFNDWVIDTKIQSDGKILFGGYFTTFTGTTQRRLIRLNSDGSKDTTFDIGSGFNNDTESISIQSDGKILVGGYFTTFTGSSQNRLIRLNSDGSKDTTFNIGSGFGGSVLSTSIQSDGKILAGGGFTTFAGSSQNRLIRLNTDGTGFWNGIVPPTSGYTVYTQKESQGPSIRVASNDSELITIARQYGGTSINTANDALIFFNGQSQYMVTNIDYENIVTNGLFLLLDAGYIPSYPRSGTTWVDLTGDGTNGALTNGPTFNSDNLGSIVFDGTDDYVSCGNTGVSFLTLSVWVYKTSSASNQGICYRSGGEWRLAQRNGTIQVLVLTSPTFSDTGYEIPLNQWINITYTYNGTGLSGSQIVYVNGTNIFSSANGSGALPPRSRSTNFLGFDGLSGYWGGRISQAIIYNRALSSTEVLQNYNAQKSRYGL